MCHVGAGCKHRKNIEYPLIFGKRGHNGDNTRRRQIPSSHGKMRYLLCGYLALGILLLTRATTEAKPQHLEYPIRYRCQNGATIITKVVSDPTQYGVCVFDDDGQIKRFIEKPLSPPSNIAIGGFFIFDDSFSTKLLYCNENSKSTIIDLLNAYKFNSKVQELRMNNFGWIDCGTTSGLNQLHRILETSEVSL